MQRKKKVKISANDNSSSIILEQREEDVEVRKIVKVKSFLKDHEEKEKYSEKLSTEPESQEKKEEISKEKYNPEKLSSLDSIKSSVSKEIENSQYIFKIKESQEDGREQPKYYPENLEEQKSGSQNSESQNQESSKLSEISEEQKREKVNNKIFLVKNIEDLVFSQIPKKCSLSCAIVCKDQFFSTYSSYQLYLVHEKKKILTAQKSRFELRSNFEIREIKNQKVIGKIQSNFTGTEFVVKNNESKKELCWVGYQPNFLGLSDQRELCVIKNNGAKLEGIQSFSRIRTYYENGLKTKFEKLSSRNAEKSTKQGVFRLDFHGKIAIPSKRNFILEDKFTEECLLFGKKHENIYFLQVKHPFSIIEAFGIALSNLDRKILVR